MPVIDQKSEEERFNETLKRMLKTPPKPHQKEERPDRSGRPPALKEDRENGRDAK